MSRMKRLGCLGLLLIVLQGSAAIGFARQGPPPPPSNDYSPANWKEFSPTGGGFKVSLPGPPKETSRKVQSPFGEATETRFVCSGLRGFVVMQVDFPKEPGDTIEFWKGFETGFPLGIGSQNQKLIKNETITVDGYTGRFFQTEEEGKLITRGKMILVKNRIYFWIAVSPIHEGAVNSENDFEKIADSFLNSFHLLKTEISK